MQPRMAHTEHAVVHLLHNRTAACGLLRGEPPQWPAGQLWARVERGFLVSCPHCQRILKEMHEHGNATGPQ